MFIVDMFNFAAKADKFRNSLVFNTDSVSIGGKTIVIRNLGHLTQMVVEHLYANLGGVETMNRLLVLNEKKFDGFTIIEKFSLFETTQTQSMQAVAFEHLFIKVATNDFHADQANSAWEAVLESLGLKKPVMATLVSDPTAPKLEEVPTPPAPQNEAPGVQTPPVPQEEKAPKVETPVASQEAPFEVKTVELVPTIKVETNSFITAAARAEAEEATAEAAMKAVLDGMSDETFQALKGLMIDEILVKEKLEPSKAAVAREILMETVTLDILKSESPKEAILAILYEKVVSNQDFKEMVTKAKEESEKVPTTVVEALDVIDDKPRIGRQHLARRKGKR